VQGPVRKEGEDFLRGRLREKSQCLLATLQPAIG
jgi:hypothetical protein